MRFAAAVVVLAVALGGDAATTGGEADVSVILVTPGLYEFTAK